MFKYRHIETDANQFNLRLQQKRGRRKGKRHKIFTGNFGFLIGCLCSIYSFSQQQHFIIKQGEITGSISPKSVVASGTGIFAAQNMMYRHTVTLYNSDGEQIAKVEDKVRLTDFGYTEFSKGTYRGAPVEASFTHNGKFLWVSNYNMEGEGFKNPGCDGCHGKEFDPGFLYKINTATKQIENVVKVGAVPKFLTISPDEKKLLVSNWSSGDVSIIDLETEKEIERVNVGVHPRGIDITNDNSMAFVAVMGSNTIAEINLEDFSVSYVKDFGRAPRHLILGENDSVLFVSLNSAKKVVKYNRFTQEKLDCKTAPGPRSMCISPNEKYLYVVNYFDNTFSKIATADMRLIESVETADKPIGICGNWKDNEVWVACYSGVIQIFKDIQLSRENQLFAPTEKFAHKLIAEKEHKMIDEEGEDIEEISHKETSVIEETSSHEAVVKRQHVDHKIVKNFQPQRSQDCNYHLIAGSFSILENAENRKAELVQLGYPAVILNGNLNYVSVSCYTTRDQANAAIPKVKSNTSYSVWVLKR